MTKSAFCFVVAAGTLLNVTAALSCENFAGSYFRPGVESSTGATDRITQTDCTEITFEDLSESAKNEGPSTYITDGLPHPTAGNVFAGVGTYTATFFENQFILTFEHEGSPELTLSTTFTQSDLGHLTSISQTRSYRSFRQQTYHRVR